MLNVACILAKDKKSVFCSFIIQFSIREYLIILQLPSCLHSDSARTFLFLCDPVQCLDTMRICQRTVFCFLTFYLKLRQGIWVSSQLLLSKETWLITSI